MKEVTWHWPASHSKPAVPLREANDAQELEKLLGYKVSPTVKVYTRRELEAFAVARGVKVSARPIVDGESSGE